MKVTIEVDFYGDDHFGTIATYLGADLKVDINELALNEDEKCIELVDVVDTKYWIDQMFTHIQAELNIEGDRSTVERVIAGFIFDLEDYIWRASLAMYSRLGVHDTPQIARRDFRIEEV